MKTTNYKYDRKDLRNDLKYFTLVVVHVEINHIVLENLNKVKLKGGTPKEKFDQFFKLCKEKRVFPTINERTGNRFFLYKYKNKVCSEESLESQLSLKNVLRVVNMKNSKRRVNHNIDTPKTKTISAVNKIIRSIDTRHKKHDMDDEKEREEREKSLGRNSSYGF